MNQTKSSGTNSACAILLAVGFAAAAFAQPATKTTTAVPRLVQFSGTLTNADGKPFSGVVGVTFSLYEEQEGGAPVWTETQNVQAGGNGEYTVLLGSTRNEGIPSEIFASGQRWLGVQAQGAGERPRALMTSVPYSLKAVDAETLGGLPASAFALATSGNGAGRSDAASAKSGAASALAEPATTTGVTGSGTVGHLARWTGTSTLGNSIIGQTSSGAVDIVGTSDEQLIVQTSSDAGGAAVEGLSTATSGTNAGVYGAAASTTGMGVAGVATAVTGSAFGVYGISDSMYGTGVKGVGVAASAEGGASSVLSGGGLWGDTSSGTQAILATADDVPAINAYSKSSSQATVFVRNDSTESESEVFSTFGLVLGGYCNINVVGNLLCSGSVGGHAVLRDAAGEPRDVALYAVQAPDNWFEDMGSGQLRNGAALVALDADYVQTVNTTMDYHVFLTPKGDCKGLYVANETPGGFEVHEMGGGSSSIAFDYRIVAKRKGFENIRMAHVPGKTPLGQRLKSADGLRPARAATAGPVGAARPPARIAALPAQPR